ncbi:MAG: hypothetical protein KDA89_21960 [Planctomycetaceae bacterium]|nr:hypothetical protein [Planctomycetaceae bacterium]
MDAVIELFQSILNVFRSLLDVVVALFYVILPWLPLLGWIAYWSLAVNWVKVFDLLRLRRGGYIGVVLLMLLAVLIWGTVSPPIEGTHFILGLTLSNYVGKLVYVTILTCIALICGSVQMNGTFGSLIDFSAEDVVEEHGGNGHGGHEHH